MKKGKETGGPAFPEAGLSGLPNGEFIHGQSGMTMRDYFASKAMQPLGAAIRCDNEVTIDAASKAVAEASYRMADAMLAARSKA